LVERQIEYLLKGYAITKRFEHLEYRVSETEKKIDFFVHTSLPPVEGIFYDGQIFDAYKFVSGLIKSAKKGVTATIYTAAISAQLQLDLNKHNDLYHIGASLKDLGRKLFAFSKMTTPASELLKNIP
jgi:hypothetical protein